MNKSEFLQIANKLKAAYPRQAFIEQPTFELWFECLEDLEAKYVNMAVIDLIKTMKYLPTISEIREKYSTYDRRTEKEKMEGASIMHKTDKTITGEEAIEELNKLSEMVCSLSNKAVPDKSRFRSHCEEIGYELRNVLYKDGLIATGDGFSKIV